MIKRNHACTLAEDVAGLVKRRRHVSMVEIMRLAGDEGKGNGELKFEKYGGNVVIWRGMSEELADAIMEISSDGLIHPHATLDTIGGIPMTYLIDGMSLKLPIVKNIPKNGYKKPHWLPVVFEPGRRCPDDPVCPHYKPKAVAKRK